MELTLLPAARADLFDIWRNGSTQWGYEQSDRYIRRFDDVFASIADHPEIGRRCDELRPGYRLLPTGAHIVFYRLTPSAIEIVRILHERMDFGRHLPI
jgi:toxin ParE1/3/4